MAAAFDSNFSFNQQLWYYYTTNRGKIRSRYNDLTRKFLAYNDSEENPHAFLRKPQFEALEMYVFVKEFMNNKQVYEMFDDWRNRRDRFSDASYYAVDKGGQIRLFDAPTEKQTDTIFKQMKKYREDYPNYIYALTMGLGKTILMATCIFYEFLLAKKYPRDKRFCHNALVFAPDKTVLQSLREIMTFDKTKVVPPEYARVLDANIKFHFLDESGTILHTIDDSDFNIIISNTQKIIVKKKRKETTAAETLFSGSGSLLSAVYGTDSTDAEDDAWDDSTLMDNQRFKKLCRLPQLGVYVDEAHHLFGADLEKQIRSSGANKTSLRDTINLLAANTSIVACYNYTGILKQFLELTQFLQYGRAFRFLRLFHLFAGVFGKGSGQRIRIPPFEENQVLGRRAAAVFFHGIIHAVLPGNLLKLPDGGIGDLDVGYALVLADQLLHGLLTVRNHGSVPASLLLQLLFLAVSHVLGNSGLKQPPGELCAADYQRQSSVFHFLLHRSSPPFSGFCRGGA